MDHRDLAKSDGSDQAMGRGLGIDIDEQVRARQPSRQRTPFMQMTFHPLERRLDTAIWRALFASSVRQARMLCTQGHVKVNGKPVSMQHSGHGPHQADLICQMRHPTYNLNPGDMFSISPKWVLQATGAPKFYLGTPDRTKKLHEGARELLKDIRADLKKASEAEEVEEDTAAVEAEAEAEEEAAAPEDELAAEQRAAKKTLKDLRKQILSLLTEKKQELSSKQKQLLRALRTDIPKMMGRKEFSAGDLAAAQQRFSEATSSATDAKDVSDEVSAPGFTETEVATSTSLLKSLRTQMQYLVEHWRRHDIETKNRYRLRKLWVLAGMMLDTPALIRPDYAGAIRDRVAAIASSHKTSLEDVEQWAEQEYSPKEYIESNPYEADDEPVAEAEDIEPSFNPLKGLAWRPRAYMSAFAFIPRYLEVNQNVCSAVYLRHPVVRPGLAEVPTPFPEGLSQLAFNWYLRRR